jgi:hypothetical protein
MATDGFNAFAWYAKWYHFGCQSVEIDDRYAASLCATRIAPGELEHVMLPWPCFVVRVPPFMQAMRINGEPLRMIVANHVRYAGGVTVTGLQDAVGRTQLERYQLHLVTANKYRILPAESLAQWAQPNPLKSYDEIRLVEIDHDEASRRQLEVIGRLVLGAVIAMNDPKAHRRYGALSPGRKASLGGPRYGTDDRVVLHRIGRPVKVDARQVISDYAAGRVGSVTSVRTLVAGHWKRQPHGLRSALRRWQHVECYWRGDEDAPRIIRPHVLTGGQEVG